MTFLEIILGCLNKNVIYLFLFKKRLNFYQDITVNLFFFIF